jgi:hypothetical protein
MQLGKRTTALIGLGLLLGSYAPVRAAYSATPAQSAQTMPVNMYGHTLLSMLNSVLTGSIAPDARKPDTRCKPLQMYSQHDVVGDPEACFMGHYSVDGGSTATMVGAP